MTEPNSKTALRLAARIRPMLAGYHPAEQGAALADLLAIWLAGYPADLREALLAHHIEQVRELVPANVADKWTF
jgi:hypothetical protein